MNHSDHPDPSTRLAPGADLPPSSASTAREREAEDLLAECLALSESDWSRAIQEACRRRPDLAGPLEELFRNVHAIDRVLQPAGDPASDADGITTPSVLGDFEILERVGGGGMGFVYRARQISLGRTVALKLIRPEHLFFAKSKERFRRETEAISRLHHPGIVPLYQAGEEHGLPYFAMEFIDGPSLAGVLNAIRFRDPTALRANDFAEAYRQVAADPGRVGADGVFSGLGPRKWAWLCCRIIARVAQALEHAHRNGVIHRDIKPSNIMVTDSGRVVIVDFGLAIADGAESLTRTGSHPGSLPYMSPEQIAGERVDHRTDLYSLGVTLYEMLTLRCPFPLSNPELARKHIASGSFERLRSRNRSVPPEVEAVCLKAMATCRDQRYDSASDFADDLLNAVTHRPIRARTFGWGRRLRQVVLRHPARSLAVVALFLACIVGPIAFAVQQYRHVEQVCSEQAATQAAITRARESEEESRAVSEFLKGVFLDASPYDAPKKDLTVREAVIASASKIEDNFKDSPRLQVKLMETTANVLQSLGLVSQGHDLAARAVKLARERLGPKDTRLASLLVTLSEYSPDVADAEVLAQEAVAIAEGHPDLDLLFASQAYARLAKAQYQRSRFANAEASVRKSIVRAEVATAAPHPMFSVSFIKLSIVPAYALLADLVRLRGAISESRQVALDYLAELRVACKDADVAVLPLLATLNDIDLDRGDTVGAERWALEALHLSEARFGHDHPQTLLARLMLAKARVFSGKDLEILLTDVEAVVAGLKEVFGPRSPHVGLAQTVRAQVLDGLGRLQDADVAYTEVLVGATGPSLFFSRVQRAGVRMKLGNLAGARDDVSIAAKSAEDLGPRREATVFERLARLELVGGQFLEAQRLLDRARLALITANMKDGLEMGRLECMRGAVLWRLGRSEEAEVLLKGCLSVTSSDDPIVQRDRCLVLKEMALLYYTRGDFEDAIAMFASALEVERALLGKDDGSVVADACRVALLQIQYGSVPDGLECAATVESRPVGASAIELSERSYLHALVLAEGGHTEEAIRSFARAFQIQTSSGAMCPLDGGASALACARLHADRGSFGMAEQSAGVAAKFFEANRITPRWLKAEARVLMARCLAKDDQFDQAAAVLGEVKSSCIDDNSGWERVKRSWRIASSELDLLRGADGASRSRPVEQLDRPH